MERLGFLSYAHKDLTLVQKFLADFEPLGRIRSDYKLTIWNDEQIRAGQKWDQTIRQSMERSDFGILLLSPSFFDSDYIVKTEIAAMLGDRNKVLIPVMLVDVPLSTTRMHGVEDLQVFQWLAPNWAKRRSFKKTPDNRTDEFVSRLLEDLIDSLKERDQT